MRMSGNTILITGGGSGIGRGLAEAFHRQGNKVIIAGRRQVVLDAVVAQNPGMIAVTFDIGDAASIDSFARTLLAAHPDLNAVLHNAGIMRPEDIKAAPAYLEDAEQTVATNLLGPIRLTAALLPHLLGQPHAAILTVTSGLAFVPMVATPTYSATKSGLHAYTMALREQLRATSVEVLEIAPPYVQTTLLGDHQATDPHAMPLADFISETMAILAAQPESGEAITGRCAPLRYAAEQGSFAQTFKALNAL